MLLSVCRSVRLVVGVRISLFSLIERVYSIESNVIFGSIGVIAVIERLIQS